MNHTQEINGRFDTTRVASAPNEKVLGRFSRSFGKNKQPQEVPDPFQAAWAAKRDVPASVCCGEDMGLVEDTGLGTIGTEWDLVHIPVNSKQIVSSVVMCFAYAQRRAT
jgi:hypothetical protein